MRKGDFWSIAATQAPCCVLRPSSICPDAVIGPVALKDRELGFEEKGKGVSGSRGSAIANLWLLPSQWFGCWLESSGVGVETAYLPVDEVLSRSMRDPRAGAAKPIMGSAKGRAREPA